jgi:ABC-type multidrug transport system fused ATPase/permease subunit
MGFSLGTSGSNFGGGPRGMIQNFGGKDGGGRAFDRRIFVRLLTYIKPHGKLMVLAFLLMLVATALTLLTPYLISVAIDRYIVQGDMVGLTWISLATITSYAGIYGSTAGQSYLLSWVGQKVLATLRSQLFHHLQRLPISYHDTHIIGVTVSRVINDVGVINDLLSQGMVTLVGDTLLLVGIVGVMVSMSPKLALYTFTVLPLMVIATIVFARYAQSAFRQTRARIAAVVGNLAEDIAGMRVIQAFAQEGASQERFTEVNQANRDANIDAMTLSFIFLPSVDFLSMLATGIVLWFGGVAVARGELTLGLRVAFFLTDPRAFTIVHDDAIGDGRW